ncbi:16S rRNA (cytidine(1402)-2'-O)-methyltransferase [Candidatus Pacearchaeota archaeon]|nr:MAG: 16S rRNA (cytidine(1402)-2'-O)-methyltransferase [Candidatus Pacearchaeota archaeon]
MNKKGKLFVVSLPIGNLKDITLRALEVLKETKYITCEDTRSLRKILNYYQLKGKKLISLYKDIEKERVDKVIKILLSGKDVVLVSEAGTPLISDPGAYLVKEAYNQRIKIVPIPGASALTCALSVSGIVLNKGFIFLGFLPRKKVEQKKLLERLPSEFPLVFFESPHRIKKTLKNLLEILGNRKCFLARELTKIHEELLWSDLETLSQREEFVGEITLIIMPEDTSKKEKTEIIEKEMNLKKEIEKLKNQGLKDKEIAKNLAQKFKISAKEIYKKIIEISE